jgi:hypothetical protein
MRVDEQGTPIDGVVAERVAAVNAFDEERDPGARARAPDRRAWRLQRDQHVARPARHRRPLP